MPSLFIAVPTHRSIMDTGCARSIAGLLYHLGLNKIDVRLTFLDTADIAWSRNHLVDLMLQDSKLTHILFIDSDMTFSPALVARLFEASKEVIGYIYPRRFKDAVDALSAIAQAGKRGLDDNAAIAEIAGFVTGDISANAFNGTDIAEVETLGMGLCLIARSVFEKLIASGQVPTAIVKGTGGTPHGFFQQVVRDGNYYSEDASFCLRWRELCGGKVYGLASKEIGHVARVEVRARPPGAVERNSPNVF